MNKITLKALFASLYILLSGCSPVIAIPAGSDVSSLILSRTTPEATFESVSLNGRSISAPYFSFEIPSGPYSVGAKYRVEAVDRCDSGELLCSVTSTVVSCSGSFHAAPNVRYRILIDPRNGPLKATIQQREGSSLYIGLEEGVLSTLTCEIVKREERRDHVPS